MHPILFEIPWLEITVHTYGVLLATAYGVAIVTAAVLGRRRGLDTHHAYGIGIAIVLGGVLGAKVLQVLVDAVGYGLPLRAAMQGSDLGGGQAGVFLGGVIFASLLVLGYCFYHGLPWWSTADPFFAAVPLGQAIGRLGCLATGCCWGRACDLSWAIAFPPQAEAMTGVPAGVSRHPVQLYSVGLNALLFGALLLVYLWRRFPGQAVLSWMLGYGVVRFTLEIFRGDDRGEWFLGLSTSQVLSVLMIVAALALWPLMRERPLPEMARGSA